MRPNISGPIIAHRLDMATSGILLCAKDVDTYKILQYQFIKRKIQKKYIALLEGVIIQNQGTINLPLVLDIDNRPFQKVCFDLGKLAVTEWRKISERKGQTLVEFKPITGRTHQLRVHAAHYLGLNCPIVGDDLYGTQSDRLYLHAQSLTFWHPHEKKEITLNLPAPFA